MMTHSGGLFRGHEIAARGLEKCHDRVVREVRGVCDVDDDLRAGNSFGEPFAGDGVDARVGRRRDDLMALLTQVRHYLTADEAGSADDNDLHDGSPSGGCWWMKDGLWRAERLFGDVQIAFSFCPKMPAVAVAASKPQIISFS